MLNQRTGPWSEPVYLHSSGFDASILHDDDGRKYIVSLDWETREGYEKPIVTSNPIESNERHDPDHLKPKYFNPDGWLRMADGSNIAKEYCEESALSEYKAERDMSD